MEKPRATSLETLREIQGGRDSQRHRDPRGLLFGG